MVFVRAVHGFSLSAQFFSLEGVLCVMGCAENLACLCFIPFCVFCGVGTQVNVQKAFRIHAEDATVAKLVDAIGLGPIGRNAVLVRVQSVAPSFV